MKAFRTLFMIVSLAIPGIALADHLAGDATPECCARNAPCCAHGCPLCAHRT